MRAGKLIPVYSRPIEAEYRTVLGRAKFNIHPDLLAEFFARLHEDGRLVAPAAIFAANLPDPDDAPFIATALALGCPVITGNACHFPPDCGARVLSPAECVAGFIR
jgi:hypothetical protein